MFVCVCFVCVCECMCGCVCVRACARAFSVSFAQNLLLFIKNNIYYLIYFENALQDFSFLEVLSLGQKCLIDWNHNGHAVHTGNL